MTCPRIFPIKAATCLQVGPMSLELPVDPFPGFDHSRPSLSPEVPSDQQQRGALPASTRSRWRQDALQAPPQILQRSTGWDGCGPFLSEGMRCVTWNTLGLVGSVFSKQKNREFRLKYLKRLFNDSNILCLQEVHGKDEYLQAIQVLADRSLLQPTGSVNTTPHTSHFLVQLHAHAWLKSCVCRARITCHDSSSCAHVF